MWTDDISFCPRECKRKTCFRNQLNIRDKTIPHSFFVERPPDCPYNRKDNNHGIYHTRSKTLEEKKMSKRIEKKILPGYYKAVYKGQKTFELRQDDADYQVGDILVLREWTGTQYTGHSCECVITYILRNAERFGLKEGYCILSIKPM